MRNWITFLMTLLVASSGSYASADLGTFNFEAGYRHDDITWKNKLTSSPDISTKTRFKDLDIFQIGVNGRSTIGSNFYVRGSAHWGWIIDGDIKESINIHASTNDFSNEATFSSRDHNIVDGRWVFDIDAAIGYPFYFCDYTTVLAPVVGYAFDEQNIRFDENGRSDIFDDSYASTSCCYTCNKFVNRWYGPFVGVDLTYNAMNQWNLYASLEYHWAQLSARRNAGGSDLGLSDFHGRTRHAHGWVFDIGAAYDMCNQTTFGIDFSVKEFRAHRHHHNRFASAFDFGSDSSYDDYSSSSSNDNGRGRLRHEWCSYSISFSLGREF